MRVGPPEKTLHPGPDRASCGGANPPGCSALHHRPGLNWLRHILHPPPVPFHRPASPPGTGGSCLLGATDAQWIPEHTHTPPLFARAPGPARAQQTCSIHCPSAGGVCISGRTDPLSWGGGYIVSASVCTHPADRRLVVEPTETRRTTPIPRTWWAPFRLAACKPIRSVPPAEGGVAAATALPASGRPRQFSGLALRVALGVALPEPARASSGAGSQRARNSPSATFPTRGLAVVSAPSSAGPLDDGTTTAAELAVPPATEVRIPWPDACIDRRRCLRGHRPPITGARRMCVVMCGRHVHVSWM